MSVGVRKQTTRLLLVSVSNQKKMSMSNDENLENVWEEIKNAVKVTPTMVFSVIGDSDSFVPCPWPRTVFQTALIEAAKSGGETWILYSGDGQEVSRSVQDAYRKYGNKEFGTKNGYIHKDNMNRHVKLINITDKETEDTRMETRVQCTSHMGRINNFLLEFEKFVSKQEVSIFSRKEDIKMPVPIALIVCEGDIETIAHIARALQNKLPVIIMKGSGKAADLILDYLEKSSELRKHAGMLFGIKFDDENIKALKKQLKIIHRNRDLIGVFDLNSDDPLKLSNIVGEVVVRCWSMEEINSTETQRIEKDTRLSTDDVNQWKITIGRPDSNTLNTTGSSITMRLLRQNSVQPEEKAMKEILEGYKKQPVPDVLNQKFTSPTSLPLYFYFGYQLLKESRLMQKCGHILLLEAIKANRCDYVRVLLDQGVKLSKKHLPELYEQTVSCKECRFDKDDCLHMQWILKQILETEAQTLCHQYRCAMEKIGEDNAKLGKYLKKIEELESSVADSARRLCCRILQYEGNKEAATNRKSSDICETSDILLWAVFANRKEIAEICWIRGENHLLSGLVCSVLLQKLSRKAKNVEEHMLSRDLAEHAKLFEERCIKIMDEMYNDYTKQAVDSMDDEAMIWGVESSPLTIAYENFMYDVVGHTCSRKLMNKQWYNDLPPNVRPFCKMMFSTMLIMNSVFVLTSVETGYESTGELFEYYVYVWAAGDFLEEMICCFGLHGSRSRFHRGYYRRMKRYVYDFWNILDFLSYAILISAVCVRYLHPAPEPNEFIESNYITNARRLFSLSLLIMYVRFLEVFLIHPTLGPTLIMIKEMLKDLIHFLLIATFVIFGVGIYYHANLYPDHKALWSADWSEWRFWRVLSLPYWQIYSDLQLEHVYGNTTCVKGDGSCPRFDWTVVVVAGGYILFTVLLLVNLVIAMFSNTFARVLQNSEKLWWYERYTAIHDYQWRVPSPFNVLFIPYRIYTVCKGSCFLKKDIEAANDFGGHKDENVMNAKEYRRELQNIIACNIYNKI